MRSNNYFAAEPNMPLDARYRRGIAAFMITCFTFSSVSPALAGGYVDGNVTLSPAKSINLGGVSVLPTFNNDQFNDQVLVGAVNNDAIRTPSTTDPVSTVSGNNYHDETDILIRGRNDLHYAFTRTYNSAPSATKVDRGLGYGWTHSYLMRLKSNDFGECPNCTSGQKPENGNSKTSSITYTDERGSEQNYLVNETTFAVTAPKGMYDTLALNTPTSGQHTLTFRNGTKYIFETPSGDIRTTPNVVARLKYIDNTWGDRLTLTYDGNGRLSNVVDNLGISGRTGLTFTYHPDGHLKDVSDWTARKWSFGYDASGNMTSMMNPLLQTLSYGYDAPKHLLTSITKPLQRDGLPVRTGFKYYENGRTFQQTDSYGVGDTLDYDLYRKSTRVTDARGGVREYFYDENGRMTKLIEPDGGVHLFENQGDLIRSKKYDVLGYATTYSYRLDKAFTGTSDTFGNVTREQDALTRTVDTTYGPFDQMGSFKDKRGTITTTSYGATTSGCDYTNRPKETRISALAGASNVLLSSQCWNANGTLNSSRNYIDASRYSESRLTYIDNGLNVSQIQFVGMPSGATITKTYTYDNLGRKKTETLKRRASPTNTALIDLTTSYDYDALDRIIKATDSLGNEVVNNYDANGQLWKITHRYKKPDLSYEARDVVTRTFEANDRVKTETDASGGSKQFSYDAAGNPIAVTDAEGHTSRIEYDAMNRKTAVIDATGYRTETAYTLRGDVTSITNANGETVSFDIDALGRKTAAIDARGFRSEFQYDENGNLTCTIDPNAQAGLQTKNSSNCSESRQYDELNRITKIIDALNGETRFSYDLQGNRLTVQDAENKTWSFAYDDLGRLASETDHSSKTTTYKPDEAGNVYERTNRLNEVTRYGYDNANRLTRVDYLKDSSAETFGYDPAGNRNAAVNGNVSYSFGWDKLNRLTSKLDSRGRSLGFTYDKVGNILTKTTYQGSTTTYVYNAANRLVMLRNPDYTQVDYQYDPAGRLLSRVTANGARLTQQYDANGWPTRLAQYDAANALISDTSYIRDRVGNILTSSDASGATTHVYDALYRLKTADYPGTANDEVFGYDKVGNRIQYTKGSLSPNANTRYYNYASGSNRLNDIRVGSIGGTLESGFSHDFEGRLIAQTGVGAKTLSWDAKGRLKTLGTETYTYDPMDYRIGRNGGSLGNLSYFLEGEHLESVESGGQFKDRYFRGTGTDELVAGWITDTDGKVKPYLFHHDNVTSTIAISGHNGGTTQATKYSAFGQTQSLTGTTPNRLKYTGREEDLSGLYYYRARYYDATIGRFISEDPIGFAGGINQYEYAGSNPVNANDPTGLQTAVSCAGNSCGVTQNNVYFTGPGYTSAFAKTYQSTIQSRMTGTFKPSGVQVTTTVNFAPGNKPVSGGIEVNVGLGNRVTASDGTRAMGTTQLSYGTPSVLVQLPAQTNPDTIVHEGWFHTICPSCQFSGHNELGNGIMNAYDGQPKIITSDPVEQALRGIGKLNYSPTQQRQDSIFDTGGSFDSSAAGGFLLYPNKPNNNQMRSVYAK